MARKRNPKRDEAFEIFKEHGGNIMNREIAEKLDVPEKTISAWKNLDKWLDSFQGKIISTKKNNISTNNKNSKKTDIRSKQGDRIINALVEAGTYSPALDLLIDIYLDAYEEYLGNRNEKLRKELAKLLGQLGLDGKNKDLIKSNGKLLDKGDNEKEKEKVPEEPQTNKLLQFRKRVSNK